MAGSVGITVISASTPGSSRPVLGRTVKSRGAVVLILKAIVFVAILVTLMVARASEWNRTTVTWSKCVLVSSTSDDEVRDTLFGTTSLPGSPVAVAPASGAPSVCSCVRACECGWACARSLRGERAGEGGAEVVATVEPALSIGGKELPAGPAKGDEDGRSGAGVGSKAPVLGGGPSGAAGACNMEDEARGVDCGGVMAGPGAGGDGPAVSARTWALMRCAVTLPGRCLRAASGSSPGSSTVD